MWSTSAAHSPEEVAWILHHVQDGDYEENGYKDGDYYWGGISGRGNGKKSIYGFRLPDGDAVTLCIYCGEVIEEEVEPLCSVVTEHVCWQPETIVIFRKWTSLEYAKGDVIALFPEDPDDEYGRHCMSYEHVGQHGGADYYCVIRQTEPASPDEYKDLYDELTKIGYNLVVKKRNNRRFFDKRVENAGRIKANV